MLITIVWVVAVLVGIGVVGMALIFGLINRFHSKNTYNAVAVNPALSNEFYFQDGKVVYVPGGNFFNLGPTVIEGVDPQSFEVLDKDFARDRCHVFYRDKMLPELCADSAQVIAPYPVADINNLSQSSCLIRDHQQVYWCDRLVQGADPKTVQRLWGDYFRDQANVYYRDETRMVAIGEVSAISDMDPDYLRIGPRVYLQGKPLEADGITFRLMSHDYARDTHAVYFQGLALKHVDVGSFKVLDRLYTQDKHHCFYRNEIIYGAQPATFKPLEGGFAMDALHVYFGTRQVVGEDPERWSTRVSQRFHNSDRWVLLTLDEYRVRLVSADKLVDIGRYVVAFEGEVFVGHKRLLNVAPEDVQPLDEEGNYVKVKDVIYLGTHRLDGASAETFRVIEDAFARDAKSLYWHQHRVADVDPDMFHYHQKLYAKASDNGEYVLASTAEKTTDATHQP